MNIGFDLDRVLVDYPPFVPETVIDRFYKNKNGKLAYRIPSKPEAYLRLLIHYSIFRQPLQDNIAFVRQLKGKDNINKLYLISGRFAFLREKTDEIIARDKLGEIFSGMYFNFANEQPHIFKDKIIKKLSLSSYVDDDFDLVDYLSEKNPQLNLFWLNNRKYGKIKNNLFAVTSIKDILPRLNQGLS
ncbi:hypothetical protein M1615_05150 [Patescibacteria group bacterium]|nr:hypothetical protein [Patescibacteria group bacterium]MCL5010039.1 hypothetical protein [Patescibacteria group bacterium]